MDTAAQRVASRHLASREGSLEERTKEWLSEAGTALASLVSGTSRLAFKQGHVVVVTVPHPDGGSETIGLRLNSWKGVLNLYYVQRDGEALEVDSMDYGSFIKFTPDGIAKWAIAGTMGKNQLALFQGFKRRRTGSSMEIPKEWEEIAGRPITPAEARRIDAEIGIEGEFGHQTHRGYVNAVRRGLNLPD